MKRKIIKPDRDFEIQAKNSKNKLPVLAEGIDKVNIYRLAYTYSSPFMPMIDLTFVFDELKRVVKKWKEKNKKDRNN